MLHKTKRVILRKGSKMFFKPFHISRNIF